MLSIAACSDKVADVTSPAIHHAVIVLVSRVDKITDLILADCAVIVIGAVDRSLAVAAELAIVVVVVLSLGRLTGEHEWGRKQCRSKEGAHGSRELCRSVACRRLLLVLSMPR